MSWESERTGLPCGADDWVCCVPWAGGCSEGSAGWLLRSDGFKKGVEECDEDRGACDVERDLDRVARRNDCNGDGDEVREAGIKERDGDGERVREGCVDSDVVVQVEVGALIIAGANQDSESPPVLARNWCILSAARD